MKNRYRLMALAVCCTALAACSGAHLIPASNIPEAGEKVATWRARIRPGVSDGIYFRNLTDTPIRITTIALYACSNVICEIVHPDNVVAAPHDSVLGLVVSPVNAQMSFSYRWRFSYAAEAQNSRQPTSYSRSLVP